MSESYAHHFGIDNIPFGIASCDEHPLPQCVSRVGNSVIFLSVLAQSGCFDGIQADLASVFSMPTLNDFAALPRKDQSAVRTTIQRLQATPEAMPKDSVVNVSAVQLYMPVAVGDFTDFSASKNHVLNAGEVILGSRQLPPAFLHLPIGYQGRASSLVVSGTAIQRPIGQFVDKSSPSKGVICQASRAIDYELEVGAIIGKPTAAKGAVMAADADDHIFGYVLVNDWSARDIQGFEMNPLGPLCGKSFGTSLSPWVVHIDALKPFSQPLEPLEPAVAPHLADPQRMLYDATFCVEIVTSSSETVTCEAKMDTLYWTFREMLAHMTVGGCSLRTGDILASGTLSGSSDSEHGCLLESTWGGRRPTLLSDGSQRGFLQDYDMVRFTGFAGHEKSGVGFGECVGTLQPART